MDFDHSTDTITADSTTDPLRIGGSGGLVIPIGTTAERPTIEDGLLRWNSDNKNLELSGSTVWLPISTDSSLSSSCSWKFSTDTTSSDPTSKYFKLNNSTLSSVTQIYISETTNSGTDASTLFGFLSVGDKISIQQKNDPTRSAIYTVSGAITDNGTWRTIPVTSHKSATIFQINEICSFEVAYAATSGTSGTVTSVSVTTANGVSGTVSNPTTTPAITLTLGDITPSSISIGTLSFSPSTGTAKFIYGDTVAGYQQILMQNKSTATTASSDFIATTNTGSDTSEYIDLGINNSGWTGSTWGTAKDGFLFVEGGASGVGNLVIGTSQANTKIKFSVSASGSNASDGILELTSPKAKISGNTEITQSMSLGRTAIATAGGTTTLTSSSTYYQTFTGTNNQTVTLPAANTLTVGHTYVITNESTGVITVNRNGGSLQYQISPNMAAQFVCTNNSSSAGTWTQYMMGTHWTENYITTTDYNVSSTSYATINNAVRITFSSGGIYMVWCTAQLSMSASDVDCWLGLHSGTAGSTTLMTGAESAVRPRQSVTLYPTYDYEIPVTVFGIATITSGQIVEPKLKSSSGTITCLNLTMTAMRIG